MSYEAIITEARKNKAMAEDMLMEPALKTHYPELIKMIAESSRIIKQFSI
jgi:hypothetical protein